MPSTGSARLAVTESDLSPYGPCVHSEELAADKLDKIWQLTPAGHEWTRRIATHLAQTPQNQEAA